MPAPGRRRREGFYTIGVVSSMFGIHPQTLRLYEKRGLLMPARTEGNTRLYSQRDIETLEFIMTLTNDLHVNVSGVEIIVHLRERIVELQRRLAELGEKVEAAEASHLGPSCTALVRVPGPRLPAHPLKDVTPRERSASPPARQRKRRGGS